MEPERLAEYRGYVASGRFSNVSMGVFAEVMAYVDELEEWKRDVGRAKRSDAKLALYLYERVGRLREVGRGVKELRVHYEQHAEEPPAFTAAMEQTLAALDALQPGDLGEAPCERA